MAALRTIQVRLTNQQKERAELSMQNAGFTTMSAFVRSLILEHDLSSHKLLREIHSRLIGDGKK